MKATFKLLFFVQKTKIKADGTAPILARVTVNGDMVTFSTQKSVKPDRWDSKAQRTPAATKKRKILTRHSTGFGHGVGEKHLVHSGFELL